MTDNYHILCDRGLQGDTDFCGAVYMPALLTDPRALFFASEFSREYMEN